MPTHIDLFSGIGGFALAAQWAGFKTVVFCEIESFCQEVLKKHWPGIPIFPDIKRLTGLQVFDIIRSNEKTIYGNNQDVRGGSFNSGNCGILRRDPSGYVENHATTRLQIPFQNSAGAGQSVSSRNESKRQGTELVGNGHSTRNYSKKNSLRKMRGYGVVQGWTNKNPGPSRGLWETPRGGLALSEMPSRMAQKEQGERDINVTLLTAGVPCQPASVAGKRRGTQDDRWLWDEVIRILGEVKPTWAIFENPCGILSLESGVVFENLLSKMEAEGYEVQPVIIPACAVNAPHKRMRVWIIAYLPSKRKKSIPQQGRGNGIKPQNYYAHDTRGQKSGWLSNIGREEMAATRKADSDAPDSGLMGLTTRPIKRESVSKTFGWAESNKRIKTPNWSEPWPSVATRLCRVDARVSNRVDRLKALGNAVVPQIPYEIIKEIARIENAQ